MAPSFPGYDLIGVYETDQACTVLGGATVFLFADDPTGIGVIDDVLIPGALVADSGCALEQAIELGIADWAGACNDGEWEWALYQKEWWNPAPWGLIALPIC
ncbi:MAG: hypothetical protein SV253_03090 [Halobacteria archaeon]|nr:hypothetical protein [Halobacteria archaeon]